MLRLFCSDEFHNHVALPLYVEYIVAELRKTDTRWHRQLAVQHVSTYAVVDMWQGLCSLAWAGGVHAGAIGHSALSQRFKLH